MDLLWKKSPQTSQELIQSLQSSQWSDSTIKTLLNRLVKKGVITFEKQGKNYLYRPLVTEKKSKSSLCRDFLNRIFGGSAAPLLQHFVEEHPLSKEEVESLKKLLKKKSS